MPNRIPFKGLDISEALLVATARDKRTHAPSEGEANGNGKPEEDYIQHERTHSMRLDFDNIGVELSAALLVIIIGLMSVVLWPL